MSQKPKRPMTSYMLWLNSAREQIKAENPGLKVTEIAKKAGKIWRGMKDKSVWQERAAKAKEQYKRELESYNAKRGRGEASPKRGRKRGKKAGKRATPAKKRKVESESEGDDEDVEEDSE